MWIKIAICELRKKIRTRTRARTLARVRCACEKHIWTCVRCACVRHFYWVCDVRSHICTFSHIFRWSKLPKSLAFHFVNTNAMYKHTYSGICSFTVVLPYDATVVRRYGKKRPLSRKINLVICLIPMYVRWDCYHP